MLPQQLQQHLSTASEWLDSVTGLPGSLGYFLILAAVFIGYCWTSSNMFSTDSLNSTHGAKTAAAREQETPDPPRNYTATQLRYFDGTSDKDNNEKPVYMSVAGTVFDVTDGKNFYGPEGPYATFAGRECGVALAKMSFDEQHLDDWKGLDELNFGERTELEGWIDKFTHYRPYPIKGKLVASEKIQEDSQRIFSLEELKQYNGTGEIPAGHAAAPIYVAAGDKVYDMSFGGVTFYGPGGPYHKFAGRDATRALAKMSLDEADFENTSIEDCTEKQLKTLQDWINTFENKKGYPVVGRLKK